MIIDVEKYNLLLAENCLSVIDLSKQSGVSEVTLSRIRNGLQKARPQTIGKIARALDTTVENLIKKQ